MSAKFVGAKDAVADQARELGIPLTIVHGGIFSDFIFDFPYVFLTTPSNTGRS